MKVVHVLKKVETIDNDIKELRKLEKSIARDKSFSTPIYMTIEKQINILLGDRIKLLELKIENPPENFTIDTEEEEVTVSIPSVPGQKKEAKKTKSKASKSAKTSKPKIDIFSDDDDIPMLTQDQIDAKFDTMKTEEKDPEPVQIETEVSTSENESKADEDDSGIKLLDVALERGSINRKVMEKEKKVKFFRENFPSD